MTTKYVDEFVIDDSTNEEFSDNISSTDSSFARPGVKSNQIYLLIQNYMKRSLLLVPLFLLAGCAVGGPSPTASQPVVPPSAPAA